MDFETVVKILFALTTIVLVYTLLEAIKISFWNGSDRRPVGKRLMIILMAWGLLLIILLAAEQRRRDLRNESGNFSRDRDYYIPVEHFKFDTVDSGGFLDGYIYLKD